MSTFYLLKAIVKDGSSTEILVNKYSFLSFNQK